MKQAQLFCALLTAAALSGAARLDTDPVPDARATSSVATNLPVRPTLTLDAARRVAAAAVAEAARHNAGGAIAIVDDGGYLLLLERLDGTFPAAAEVSIGKARTAAKFRKSTGDFERIINDGRTTMVALEAFTPLRGGVPIVIDGTLVGAIGVSGAASAEQDEIIALVGAAALEASTTDEVTAYDKDVVASAFARGAPLLETAEFKIHASRRDKPGLAEIHTDETDIIYVLEGGATFITGGEIVDGKVTAPDEIRGESIRNGDERTLKPGDVIIVPRGVPHWFKEIEGPFLYYVVKVIHADP